MFIEKNAAEFQELLIHNKRNTQKEENIPGILKPRQGRLPPHKAESQAHHTQLQRMVTSDDTTNTTGHLQRACPLSSKSENE